MNFLVQAVSLLNNYTLVTLGQQRVFPGGPECNNGTFIPANPVFSTCVRANLTRRIDPPFNTTTWPAF